MRKLVCIILITTLGSCGLFQKSTKTVEKQELVERIDESIKVTTDSNRVQQSSKQEQVDKTIDEQTRVQADEISIGADGTLSAKGNVKFISNKHGKESSIRAEDQAYSVSYSGDSVVRKQEQKKQFAENKVVVKEPPSVFWWLGLIVGIGLMIVGVVVWRRL